MGIHIPYNQNFATELSQQEQHDIDEMVCSALSEFRANKREIESLAIECLSNISNCTAVASELKTQGVLKRFLGTITGKNQKMRDAMNHSAAHTQYAQQQILVRLMEQNASILEFNAVIHQEHRRITLEFKEQLSDTAAYLQRLYQKVAEDAERTDRIDEEMDRSVFSCPHCGGFHGRYTSICPYCGAIVHKYDGKLTTPEAKRAYHTELQKLSEVIQRMDNGSRTSRTKKLSYFQRIKRIQNFAFQSDLPKDIRDEILQQCRMLRDKLNELHIEIAVVGTVKAGKSTLINALLGVNLAAVQTNPETSVLAKYKSANDQGSLIVRFYNEKEWPDIFAQIKQSESYMNDYRYLNARGKKITWVGHEDLKKYDLDMDSLRSELCKFTSRNSPIHFFVKEVEVGVPGASIPHDVCIVDTPGLDDFIKARSEVTERYLDTADAVLACIKAKTMYENSEVRFLSRLLQHRGTDTLYIIATQIDEIEPDEQKNHRSGYFRTILKHLETPGEATRDHRVIWNYVELSAKMYNYTIAVQRGNITEKELRQYYSMMVPYEYEDRDSICRDLEGVRRISGVPFLISKLEKHLYKRVREELWRKKERVYQDFKWEIDNLCLRCDQKLNGDLEILAADESRLLSIHNDMAQVEVELDKLRSEMEKLRTLCGGE